MNNQAAQTMPERALAAWTGKHRTDAENRAFLAGYETCQSDMLDAAPAASGGERTIQQRCLADPNPYKASESPLLTNPEWGVQLNSPAGASGGDEPDPLVIAQELATSIWSAHYREDSPNWEPFDNLAYVLSQISNMVSGMTRVMEPQSAASVSERARELRERAEAHGGGVFVSVGDIRAIEQALTKERGAASYDAGMAMHWIERYAAGIDEECQLDRIAEAFTTPQPSADAVRELVAKWREDAEIADRNTEGNSYASCADELESLLSGGSHA